MLSKFEAKIEWVNTAARNVAVVHMAGDLAAGAMDEFSHMLAGAISKGSPCLVLDFQNVNYIGSLGLRELLKLRKTALDGGGWVKIAALRREIRERVFDAINITQLFDIYTSVGEALGTTEPQAADTVASETSAETPASGAAQTEDRPNAKRPVILVIDDNPMVQKVLQRILEPSGYTVITASSGETGRDIALEVGPSLILLDINMPGIDGGETARCLADELKTADIPVIFVSGLINGQDPEEPGPGGYPMIGKPFERAKLLDIVGRYIRAFQTGR